MSCNITYGFANVCLTVGGIKELYIAQYDKNLQYIYDQSAQGQLSPYGTIIGFTGSTASSFYTFECQVQTASLNQTLSSTPENGVVSYTQEVTLSTFSLNQSLLNNINILGKGRWRIIALGNDLNYWMVGELNGCYVQTGSGGLGKAYGDLNGHTLQFDAIEPNPIRQISSSAIATLGIIPAQSGSAWLGVQGFQGIQGPQSSQGVQGFQGPQGILTSNGITGSVLTTISSGPIWTPGPLGVSVKLFGAVGDGVTDDTSAIQAAINSGSPVYIPQGTYKTTSTITLPNQNTVIRGAGMFLSTINFVNSSTQSCFKASAITYMKPNLQDFGIVGSTGSGIGLDFSQISSEVYDGIFRNLYIYSGLDSIYAPLMFSMMIDTVIVNSYYGHGFRISCGPSTTFINCYASQIASNKAGYRLLGLITLYSCNGIDGGDYWGVFGQDPTATDGFQNDFPGVGNDYPDVNLYNCNVEYFAKNGFTLHNIYRNCIMQGGKIDRQALSSSYISLVTTRSQSITGTNPIVLAPGYVFIGSGVPNGGTYSFTQSWLYAGGVSQAIFSDRSGAFANVGVTTYRSNLYNGQVPIATMGSTLDVYQGSSTAFNAIKSTRLTLGYTHYTTSSLTPVGSNQAIVVTGISKAIVTPSASASISTATFDQIPGAGTDYQRNGDLLIEAGNSNLTIVHTPSGANTFRLSGGTSSTLSTGQITRFCWSTTSTQWIQV